MGRLNATLPDDLIAKFRKEVGRRLGAKKGVISEAVKEAVELWMEQS